MAIRRQAFEEGLRRHGVSDEDLSRLKVAAEKQKLTLREVVRVDREVDQGAVVSVLGEMSGLPVLRELDFERLDAELVRVLPITLARSRPPCRSCGRAAGRG